MGTTTAMEPLMTTAEVAQLLRTSPETVRYWRHVGKGPLWVKTGRRVVYRRGDVESWIATQTRGGSAA